MNIKKVIRKLDSEIKWMRSELDDLEKLAINYKFKECRTNGGSFQFNFEERHHYTRGKRDMMMCRINSLVKIRDEIKEESEIASTR
jgi:hypothetical protein